MSDIAKSTLNPEQEKSVMHEQGPLLIIAGAGTGKTTVITHKIAHLIVERKVKPSEILALTFTDKAAYQMQEKVDILVPYGFTDTWISTFHSFGDRLLRDNALELGMDPDFKVLTRPQASVFFRENLFKFNLQFYRPLGNPTKFVDAMISLFSRARDEDVSPQDYLAYAQGLKQKSTACSADESLQEEAEKHLELARCYAQYQELLLKTGKLDFANQFFLALKLLREHPSTLKRYQNQFRYILVDEFQDTNYAQFELVKLLAAKHRNLTVVADDDQSIYKWRGAAISNILGFMECFPDSEKIALTRNYRSTQPILDAAYQLIQNNNPDRFEIRASINKKLVGLKKEGSAPVHMHFDTLSSESDWVADFIQKAVNEGQYGYKDFAILVRSNSTADPFIRALNMRGIPWQFSGNQGLYTRPEVRLCISFLRTIANPMDSLSLFYLATSSVYQLSPTELSRLMHIAKRKQWDLFFTLNKAETLEEEHFFDDFLKAKNALVKDVESYILSSKDDATGKLLYTFLSQSGLLASLAKEQTAENESALCNLAKFFDMVRNFEYATNEDRVLYFVQYLDMLIEAGDDPAVVEAELDTPAVNVMTIHKAKGLEFAVVFMVSLVETKFPWPKRSEPIELPEALIKDILPMGDFHLQEERRLFYVAMTRAKDALYLTSGVDYGTKQPRKISRFIKEAVAEQRDKPLIKASAIQAIERNAPAITPPISVVGKLSDEKILSLSYYQIDDYLTCPLKYKYVHLLHVPIMTHHTVAYGKALHDAVQHYHQCKMQHRPVSEEDVLNVFENSFRKEGFISQEHITLRLKSAEVALKNFYREQEILNIIPSLVEQEFSFLLNNNRLVGRWDRVDVVDGMVTVVDFKSSEMHKQQEADKKAKDNLQLSLYSLAYKHATGKLPDFKELRFLETGLVGRVEVTEKDVERVLEAVEKASVGIRGCDFEAKPNYLACSYCAYNQICPCAQVKSPR